MLHLFIYTVAPLFEDEQISLQKPPRNHTKLMLCRCRSGVIPWRHDANLFPTVSSTSIEIEQIFHCLAGIGAAKVNQKFDVNDVDDVKLRSRWFNPWPFDSIWFPSWRSPTTFTNGHLPIPKSQKGHQQHCQVHFVRMEKFLPDFHTNPTSVSPQAGTSPKNSKVAGSQPHPARRNLDLWGKQLKMRILLQVPAFWVGNKNFWWKKNMETYIPASSKWSKFDPPNGGHFVLALKRLQKWGLKRGHFEDILGCELPFLSKQWQIQASKFGIWDLELAGGSIITNIAHHVQFQWPTVLKKSLRGLLIHCTPKV